MDTNEPIEPEGGQDVSSSQDTSSDVAQPTDSENIVDGNQSEEVGEASLLAGKYKTPEELEKAYNELQTKLGEQGQKAELVNLIEQRTGKTRQQIKAEMAQLEQARIAQAYQDNPGGMALQEVQQLKSQLALQAEEKELDNFLSSDEGKCYSARRAELQEAAFHMPSMRDKPYAEIATKLFGEARAQGQQDAYKRIEQKQNTQATGVSQAPPKGKLTVDDLKSMSTKEMESVLPWADTSQRLY